MAEDTERSILEAATRVFTERGFAGARMQEIADEAGINKALLHYYFRNKASLFEKIFEREILNLIPRLKTAIETEGPIMDRIERVVELYITTLKERPHLPVFIMHELSQKHYDFIDKIKDRLQSVPDFRALAMQIMEEQAAGIIRPVPPLHLVLNVLSLSIFPFMVKPIFCNIMEVPEADFMDMMDDRKEVIMDFIRNALVL